MDEKNIDPDLCVEGVVRDVTQPAQPKTVSKGNFLGTKDLSKDIADSYFPEFAGKPGFKLLALGGRRPVIQTWGTNTTGATAHGSRLYVRSSCHLYCLGEK
jgi:hypothetical protein